MRSCVERIWLAKVSQLPQGTSLELVSKHHVKGFYALIDGEDFEAGTRALMQATGIGKLKPNIILMGYKSDWQTCERKELVQYFNVMHKVSSMLFISFEFRES